MNELTILIATFVSVLIVSMLVSTFLAGQRDVARRLESASARGQKLDLNVDEDIRGLPVTEQQLVKHYFAVTRSDANPNSLQNRLIRAGYFSSAAIRNFQIIRVVISTAVFTVIYLAMDYLFPEVSKTTVTIVGLFAAALTFFLSNIVLERMGVRKEIEYRKIFPDFMDTLLVCIDAGLSLEAAIDRVAMEFLKSSKKDFGLHLAIMMLEVRGGRRLREALMNFATRLHIDEARSMAVLFRQSEELGSSVTKALRVFSQEMRDKRMVRAEEKANTLPLKMLFPLATFLFPMSILIVMVPIFIRVIDLLKAISPSSQ